MKKIIISLVFLFSLSCFAEDYPYKLIPLGTNDGVETMFLKDAQSPYLRDGVLLFKIVEVSKTGTKGIKGSKDWAKGESVGIQFVVNCETQKYKSVIIASQADEAADAIPYPIDFDKLKTTPFKDIPYKSILAGVANILCKPDTPPAVAPEMTVPAKPIQRPSDKQRQSIMI